MAATFVKEVQQWNTTSGPQALVITLSAGIAAGDFAVIMWEEGNDNVDVLASVSDSKNSSNWTVLSPSNDAGGSSYCGGLAYGQITNALLAGDTITLNWTNATGNWRWGTIFEFAGIATSTPQDGATVVINDTFTLGAVSLPITTGQSGDVIVGIVAQLHNLTYTVGGGFTDQANQSFGNPRRSDYLYKIGAGAGAEDPAGSLSGGDNYRGVIAAFKAAAAGGTPQNLVPSAASASAAVITGLLRPANFLASARSASAASIAAVLPGTPIVFGELEYHLSGGAANTDHDVSLGAAMATATINAGDLNDLWDDVSPEQSQAGVTTYACIYLRNNTTSGHTWSSVQLWIDQQPGLGSVAVALDSAAVGSPAASLSPFLETAPSPTLTFSAPLSKGVGLSIGSLAPGQSKAIWLRRTLPAGVGTLDDAISIRCEGDDIVGACTVGRSLYQPYAVLGAPGPDIFTIIVQALGQTALTINRAVITPLFPEPVAAHDLDGGEWGVDGAGNPYFDPGGAAPSERANLSYDPDAGMLACRRADGSRIVLASVRTGGVITVQGTPSAGGRLTIAPA